MRFIKNKAKKSTVSFNQCKQAIFLIVILMLIITNHKIVYAAESLGEVCETKIIISKAYVRSSPEEKNSEILGIVEKDSRVQCIGKPIDNWQAIIYHNNIGYIFASLIKDNQYLKTFKKIELLDESNYSNYGNKGRLIIPDVGINVAVTEADMFNFETNRYAQEICNREDNAVYTLANGRGIIADHKHQGFDGLYNVLPGMKAYLLQQDGYYYTLVCTQKFDHGVNDEVTLRDDQGNDCCQADCDLFMYTCNPAGWWDITVTYWNYE